MTFRENTLAVLNYQPYEKMPVVSFGYWAETVEKWAEEGHITREEALGYQQQGDNSAADRAIMRKLGFDFNWNSCIGSANTLFPPFETEVLEQLPDGSRVIRDGGGLICKVKPGVTSSPPRLARR